MPREPAMPWPSTWRARPRCCAVSSADWLTTPRLLAVLATPRRLPPVCANLRARAGSARLERGETHHELLGTAQVEIGLVSQRSLIQLWPDHRGGERLHGDGGLQPGQRCAQAEMR